MYWISVDRSRLINLRRNSIGTDRTDRTDRTGHTLILSEYRKKKCILFISRVCLCLDRLRLRQKDSNLIFAWNTFYRLFIIVLRYISSFATVDVNLTHSYWAGQAFCCNQPLCYITLSFFGICIVYIYWWSLYARFIPYLYGFKLFSLSTCSR